MTTVLGIVSGKGGTGKSTVSCGLAVAFASMYKRVLLVDLDEGLRCLDLMMGIEKDVVYDLGDVLSGQDINTAVYTSPEFENIKIIPAPQNAGILNPASLEKFIKNLGSTYDYIIFDFPAGADFSLCNALGKNAQIIAVSNMDPVSVRDAAVTGRNIEPKKNPPRLIINKFNADYIKNGVFYNIDDIIDNSAIRLIGLVPNSSELTLFSVTHSLSKRGKAFKSFLRIAKRINKEDVLLPNYKKI